MLEIVFRPKARDDLADAYRWYEDKRIGLGDEFLLVPAGAALAICGITLRVTKRPETRVGRICSRVLRAYGDEGVPATRSAAGNRVC